MNLEEMTKEELIENVRHLRAARENADSMREIVRHQEELYKAALEYTGTAVLVLEDDMTISAGNHKTEIITGYSQTEIQSRKPFTEYVALADRERMMEYFNQRRLGSTDIPTEYEFLLVQKDGGVRDILISVGMIPGSRRSLISLIDITDRARAEVELRASEHRFRDTAQLLPGIICEWDSAWKLTYTNMKGLETFLLTQEDFRRGVYLFDLIEPGDRARAEKDINNILHGDYGNPGEYTVTRKDGVKLHLLVNSSPILDGAKPLGMRTCIINITDRVKAEQSLRESEKRFKSIVSWSPIGIALCDGSGRPKEMNSAFTRMFGISESQQVSELDDVLKLAELSDEMYKKLLDGETVEYETELVGADGLLEPKVLLWHITPLEKNNETLESHSERIPRRLLRGQASDYKSPSTGMEDAPKLCFGVLQSCLVQVQDATEKRKADKARLMQARKETEQARHVIENLRKEIMDRATFHNMVSRSPLMKDIFTILPVVSQSPATVLVSGESGTGKELVARSLHELGPRAGKPFVAINCSALPDNLLESELFGYKAGAFTDAKKDKPGVFSRANGGTVFLDEIGDISAAMQVKLLRVLQEKTFEQLGGTQQIKVDVRVIAATNKDLSEKVKQGEFREDLFYRINVLSIKLPSLRERICDIPLLCEHFIGRFNVRYNKGIRSISQDAINILLSHSFPGNIRELENAIEHAFVFCNELEIAVAHLPQQLTSALQPQGIQSISHVKDFDELEKLYLLSVLAEMGGSKIKTAHKLGVHKATLFRKLKKLGIDKEASSD